jgi:hypothetical protein
MSSGCASVRGDDGICMLRERYLGANSLCSHFMTIDAPVDSGSYINGAADSHLRARSVSFCER